MAETSKLGAFILRMLEQFGSDFLAAAVVHRGYQTTPTGDKDGKSLNAKGVKDNAIYRNLIAAANKKFRCQLQQKLTSFIGHLWKQIDQETRDKLIEKSSQSVRLNAAHIATFNAESEAKQLLAIPLVIMFAQMAIEDEEKAMYALRDFCEQSLDQMMADYEIFVAQPETIPDKFIRWILGGHSFSDWLQNRDEQAKRNVAKAQAPGGIIFKIKYQRRKGF